MDGITPLSLYSLNYMCAGSGGPDLDPVHNAHEIDLQLLLPHFPDMKLPWEIAICSAVLSPWGQFRSGKEHWSLI